MWNTVKVKSEADHQKWVLDKIGEYIAEAIDISGLKARVYSHYIDFTKVYYLNRSALSRNEMNVVWFTHSRESVFRPDQVLNAMNYADLIIFQTEKEQSVWVGLGLTTRTTVLPGGRPEWEEIGEISKNYDFGVFSKCYPRKRPDLLVNHIQNMPEKKFLVVGAGWQNLDEYDNVTVMDVEYSDYQSLYLSCRSILVLSDIEGGPLSALDAISLKVPVITTDTGVARMLKGCVITDASVEGTNGAFDSLGTVVDFSYVQTWNEFKFSCAKRCKALL